LASTGDASFAELFTDFPLFVETDRIGVQELGIATFSESNQDSRFDPPGDGPTKITGVELKSLRDFSLALRAVTHVECANLFIPRTAGTDDA
jgi:hypothetical protein